MVGTRGTSIVDWDESLSMTRMRSERRAKGAAAGAADGYDAVLLMMDPNIRYVTSVATSSVSGAGGYHYTLLIPDGRVTHWDTADHAMVQRHSCPWLDDVRFAAPGIGIVPAALGYGPAAARMADL